MTLPPRRFPLLLALLFLTVILMLAGIERGPLMVALCTGLTAMLASWAVWPPSRVVALDSRVVCAACGRARDDSVAACEACSSRRVEAPFASRLCLVGLAATIVLGIVVSTLAQAQHLQGARWLTAAFHHGFLLLLAVLLLAIAWRGRVSPRWRHYREVNAILRSSRWATALLLLISGIVLPLTMVLAAVIRWV